MKYRAFKKVSEQLKRSDLSRCVLYQGNGAGKGGYGRIVVNKGGKSFSYAAHRVAYELRNGEIPDGHVVRHKCHNPRCINPRHLETGTHADNAKDRVDAGRSAPQKGAQNGNAKTTAEDRATIRQRRAAGETLRAIAADYGIHLSTVYAIMKSKN